MFNWFKNNEKKVDEIVEKILPFLEEIKTDIKYRLDKDEIFMGHIFEDDGNSNASSSLIHCKFEQKSIL
ncbi:uncharacterized protein METZ01_LOCUS204456, partial [marine metagenome]